MIFETKNRSHIRSNTYQVFEYDAQFEISKEANDGIDSLEGRKVGNRVAEKLGVPKTSIEGSMEGSSVGWMLGKLLGELE